MPGATGATTVVRVRWVFAAFVVAILTVFAWALMAGSSLEPGGEWFVLAGHSFTEADVSVMSGWAAAVLALFGAMTLPRPRR